MTAPIDVRGLQYMPLFVERLQRSKAWVRCKRRPELAFYLMNLWMRAYREVPAGSIENDDDILADAAMCGPDEWDVIRAEVLRGWEEIDGRLYHPVVTEIATNASATVKGNKNRTAAARETLAQMRLDLAPESDGSVTDTVTDDKLKLKAEAESKAEEKQESIRPAPSSTTSCDGEAAAGPSLEDQLRGAAGLVGDPSPALRKTGVIVRLMAQGVSLERIILPAVRGVAADGRRGNSWAYYVRAIEDLVKQAGAVPPAGAAPHVSVASVLVVEGTPEGRAWTEHECAGGRAVRWIPTRSGMAKSFPTRWPPGHEPREAAA